MLGGIYRIKGLLLFACSLTLFCFALLLSRTDAIEKKKKKGIALHRKNVHLFEDSSDTYIFNIALQTVLSGGFENLLLNRQEFGIGVCIGA